jgi:hypothetical protein
MKFFFWWRSDCFGHAAATLGLSTRWTCFCRGSLRPLNGLPGSIMGAWTPKGAGETSPLVMDPPASDGAPPTERVLAGGIHASD